MPKIKKPVKVSIIIPTLNEQSYLRKLLDDIKSQRIDDKLCSEIEIIVADGHSKDKTRQIAKSYGAKIVDGPYHPGIGRNNGAKVARGEIIYFMDADILLKDNSFIQKTLKEFITKKLDCATVPQLPFFNKKVGRDKKNFITGLFIMSNILVELNRKSRPRATATCMILRKKSFLKVKGFDPRIYWGEDSEPTSQLCPLAGFSNTDLANQYSPRRGKPDGQFDYER